MERQLDFSDEANLVAARAVARTSDPWTSHAAARSITEEQLRDSQRAVLDAFRQYGALHHEALIELYEYARVNDGKPWPRQSESGLRTRTKELRDAGFIEDTGETIRLPSGRQSKVWRAAPTPGPSAA